MNAMALDTHAHVKRLVGAGMSESQAEAVIEALRETAELPDIGTWRRRPTSGSPRPTFNPPSPRSERS